MKPAATPHSIKHVKAYAKVVFMRFKLLVLFCKQHFKSNSIVQLKISTMKKRTNSGINFRSMAALSLASACLLFTACEKESANALNPEQGVNSAGSNSPSALVKEYDAKMDEQLSLLPLIGARPVEEAAQAIEQSLNTVFSRLSGGDFQNFELDSVVQNVNINNGEVSFLNENSWLLQSGTVLTNWALENVNNQIYGIDVVVETLNNPAVVQVKTFIMSSGRITGPINFGISCLYTQPRTPRSIADNIGLQRDPTIALRNLYNFCENGIFNVFADQTYTILETKLVRFTPLTHSFYYLPVAGSDVDYLYNENHPDNVGQFDASGRLSTARLNDYVQGLSNAINDNPPGTGPALSPLPFNEEWIAVVTGINIVVKDPNIPPVNVGNHHTAAITYIRRRSL